MKWVKKNDEVLYPKKDSVLDIDKSDIIELVQIASNNKRGSARYCLHNSIGARVHEMLIYHKKGTYIRPHKHLGKMESLVLQLMPLGK